MGRADRVCRVLKFRVLGFRVQAVRLKVYGLGFKLQVLHHFLGLKA